MKVLIMIAAIAFYSASCNNPSSPARTTTDSTSVNSTMDNNAGTMNNSDTMNNTDTMNNRRTDTINNQIDTTKPQN